MTQEIPPSHQHRARVDLPDWMRNPTAPKMTLARRLSRFAESRPALRDTRRWLWRWRDRTRWSESHPTLVGIVSFVVVGLVATVLVTAALYVFASLMARGGL